MEKLYKELEDAKAAVEKLTVENRTKIEQSEQLWKAHNQQLSNMKEAKLVIEKQTQQLNAKEEEISSTKQMYEDASSKLQEKELIIKELRSAHDKLRADNGKKLHTLEVNNKELLLALEEANMKIQKQDQEIRAFKEEIEHVKDLLSVSQKKASQAEQRAEALKDTRKRDDFLMSLEEENVKIKEQLKWKKEQFEHLQEAHEKVQDQFSASKREWEQDRSTLIDDISLVQTKLDSQVRISEDLQYKLQACNQALAHEESRRKLLQVQMSESKASYENVFAECQEAKSKIESLSVRRDEEIAALRNLLSTKETLSKEAEFRIDYLEKENQELKTSLKEFQEAQIKEAGSVSSLTKLRNKLRGLERVHKDCSAKLESREAEWRSQMENMIGDLNSCKSELIHKDKQVHELQIELEDCYSSIMQLKLQNVEIDVMLTMYKSGLSNAYSNLLKPEVAMKLHNGEAKEKISLLIEQLDQKNNALIEAHGVIEQEREIAALLKEKIESLGSLEQKYILTLKEVEHLNEMLEESYLEQFQFKEQALQTENVLKEDLRKVLDAFDEVNSELAERIQEENEIEFELDRWKSAAENLQRCLDESQEFRREMECSLLAQVETEQTLKQEKEHLLHLVEEKERRADSLQQELLRRDTETAVRTTSENVFELEEDNLLHNVKQKDKSNLTEKFDWKEKEFMQRELDAMQRELEAAISVQIKMERSLEQEERLLQVIQEKDQIIESFQLHNQQHDLTRSIKLSALGELEEKKTLINLLHGKCEMFLTAQVLGEVETRVKDMIIVELGEEISSLQQKLEFEEKSISCSKIQVKQLEAELEAKQMEMEKAMDLLGSKLRSSGDKLEKLEKENRTLMEGVAKLSSENGDLLAVIEEFSEQISQISNDDIDLIGKLGKIVENFENENELPVRSTEGVELYDSDRENEASPHSLNSPCSLSSPRSFSAKNIEAIPDRRSPLIERNVAAEVCTRS